jgi:inorganic pyrophosphatase
MDDRSAIVVVVEIPRGSRNKYETDHVTGEIYLDRMLFTATRYPADYGFFPDTLAEDGDPLDVLVLVGEPTFPGCRIRIRPIGVFMMDDQGLADHKVIAVPAGDNRWDDTRDITDLPEHLQLELEHFFSVYKDLEHKKTVALGWKGADDALRIISAARAAFSPD